MTWALVVWSVLILVWMIGGGAAADCGSERGGEFLSDREAQTACEAGTGIGIAFIGVIGFMGFVVLSLVWFMTRPRQA